MFERVFQWTMRRGSRILFWLSLPYLFVALLQFVAWIIQMFVEERSGFLQQTVIVLVGVRWLYTLSTLALLLFGALVIDRLDRWLGSSPR